MYWLEYKQRGVVHNERLSFRQLLRRAAKLLSSLDTFASTCPGPVKHAKLPQLIGSPKKPLISKKQELGGSC